MSWSTSITSAPERSGIRPDHLAEVLRLLVGEPGGGLVEQHDPRAPDHGPRDLDEPALARAEPPDLRVR